MTRRMAVSPFEDTVTVDSPHRVCCRNTPSRSRSTRRPCRCTPGTYRLNVVAKDMVGGNMNNYEVAITVPRLDPDKATTSTLILADHDGKGPRAQHRHRHVRDRRHQGAAARGRRFQARREDGDLHEGVQSRDATTPRTNRPGEVEYEIVRKGSNEKIASIDGGPRPRFRTLPATQVTLEKFLNLKGLEPGQYTVQTEDHGQNQETGPHQLGRLYGNLVASSLHPVKAGASRMLKAKAHKTVACLALGVACLAAPAVAGHADRRSNWRAPSRAS